MKTKSLDLSQCDLKFDKGEEGVLEGYLSVFGEVDSYGDTVFKGAYENTLAERKHTMPMLLNHDSFGVPIGVWREMAEDDHGLRVVGEFTKGNTLADQVFSSVKHGAMSGLSIGYRAIKSEPNDHGGEDLHEIKLREGSVVTFPADDHARIDTIKFEEIHGSVDSIKDFEWILRDAGYSRKLANRLVSQFKELCQSDSDGVRQENQQLKAALAAIQADREAEERLNRLRKLV